jgi:hypothetical protein
MPKFKVVTKKSGITNYTTSSFVEALDSDNAWVLAIEAAVSSDEEVLSVEVVKYGIYCVRGAGSVMGYSEAWMKGKDDAPKLFDTKEDAEAEVERVRKGVRSVNLSYMVQEYT